PENSNWMAHRCAQCCCLLQVRDAEDGYLLRNGLGNLDHAMAIRVCFDDREQVNIRSEFLADKGYVMTQCAAIDLSPTAVMFFHHFCALRGVVICGSRR